MGFHSGGDAMFTKHPGDTLRKSFHIRDDGKTFGFFSLSGIFEVAGLGFGLDLSFLTLLIVHSR